MKIVHNLSSTYCVRGMLPVQQWSTFRKYCATEISRRHRVWNTRLVYETLKWLYSSTDALFRNF